jgi:hypothetical protein
VEYWNGVSNGMMGKVAAGLKGSAAALFSGIEVEWSEKRYIVYRISYMEKNKRIIK